MVLRLMAALSAVAVLYTLGAQALENGLERTPHMGWNSWNVFACDVNETVVRGAADAMTEHGLAALGYDIVWIDDCWMAPERDPDTGDLQADPDSFPSGIAALADYVHAQGLRLGIYTSMGYETCQGLPASLGHEDQDAAWWASQGVDALKADNCNTDGTAPEMRFPPMRDALLKTGRDIVFNLCEWGRDNPMAWAPDVGNSWRTTMDIKDEWISITNRIAWNSPTWRVAAPGQFNDPDMLEVYTHNGCTDTEYRTHFSMWSIMKAPLILGMDLTTISDAALAIITNDEIIAVNQDPLAKQGRRVWSDSIQETLDDTITVPCDASLAPDAQQWSYDADTRMVRNPASDWCLVADAQADSKTASTQVMVTPCDPDNDALKWKVRMASPDTVQIVSDLNGECLDVWGSNDTPMRIGKYVQTRRCDNTGKNVNQRWTMALDGTYVNQYQGMCLTIDEDAPSGGSAEVWASTLQDGSVAFALFNAGSLPQKITAAFADGGLSPDMEYAVRDLWAHEDMGSFRDSYTAIVPRHGTVMVRVSPLPVQ